MWQTILLSLLAGAMSANATPHFVKGITKEPYPNVFGGSPVSNLVAGWSGFVLAAFAVVLGTRRPTPCLGIRLRRPGCPADGLVSRLGSGGWNNRQRRGAPTGHPARRRAGHPVGFSTGAVVIGDQPSRACMTANVTSSASASLGGIPTRGRRRCRRCHSWGCRLVLGCR